MHAWTKNQTSARNGLSAQLRAQIQNNLRISTRESFDRQDCSVAVPMNTLCRGQIDNCVRHFETEPQHLMSTLTQMLF